MKFIISVAASVSMFQERLGKVVNLAEHELLQASNHSKTDSKIKLRRYD